jgi:hypothetical protein
MKIAQEIYNQIAQEIDSKNIDKGTWTRAVAESDGNKQKTEAAYIKYRARALSCEPLEQLKENKKKIKKLLSDSYLFNALSMMHIISGVWIALTTGLVIYIRITENHIAITEGIMVLLLLLSPPLLMAGVFALRPRFGNIIGMLGCLVSGLASLVFVESSFVLFALISGLSILGFIACIRSKQLFGKNRFRHTQLKYMLDRLKWENETI